MSLFYFIVLSTAVSRFQLFIRERSKPDPVVMPCKSIVENSRIDLTESVHEEL